MIKKIQDLKAENLLLEEQNLQNSVIICAMKRKLQDIQDLINAEDCSDTATNDRPSIIKNQDRDISLDEPTSKNLLLRKRKLSEVMLVI